LFNIIGILHITIKNMFHRVAMYQTII